MSQITHNVEQLIVLERLGRQASPPVREVAASSPSGDAPSEVSVGGNPEVSLSDVDDLHAYAHVPFTKKSEIKKKNWEEKKKNVYQVGR